MEPIAKKRLSPRVRTILDEFRNQPVDRALRVLGERLDAVNAKEMWSYEDAAEKAALQEAWDWVESKKCDERYKTVPGVLAERD